LRRHVQPPTPTELGVPTPRRNDRMTPGLLPELSIHRLGPTAPSRFAAARRCALRELYAASRSSALLTTSPAAFVGTAAHEVFREVGAGALGGSRAIAQRFDALVAQAEDRLSESWLNRRFVPLQRAVPQFAVRRRRLIDA